VGCAETEVARERANERRKLGARRCLRKRIAKSRGTERPLRGRRGGILIRGLSYRSANSLRPRSHPTEPLSLPHTSLDPPSLARPGVSSSPPTACSPRLVASSRRLRPLSQGSTAASEAQQLRYPLQHRTTPLPTAPLDPLLSSPPTTQQMLPRGPKPTKPKTTASSLSAGADVHNFLKDIKGEQELGVVARMAARRFDLPSASIDARNVAEGSKKLTIASQSIRRIRATGTGSRQRRAKAT
jgi:hypothetical protein